MAAVTKIAQQLRAAGDDVDMVVQTAPHDTIVIFSKRAIAIVAFCMGGNSEQRTYSSLMVTDTTGDLVR